MTLINYRIVRFGWIVSSINGAAYLQESKTKTTSLMVMLVSAMLVDKMTCGVFKKNRFKTKVLINRFLNCTVKRLQTLVTPSGAGSNTRLCSSLGIWEWSGRIRYRWPPLRDTILDESQGVLLRDQGIQVTISEENVLLECEQNTITDRNEGSSPGVSALNRWGSSLPGRLAQPLVLQAFQCTLAKPRSARTEFPSHSTETWHAWFQENTQIHRWHYSSSVEHRNTNVKR